MLKEYNWSNRFMGSRDNYLDADIILAGAPMDYTVSYRSGARYGPQKIRETSFGLEEYSPYVNRELSEKAFFDAGDIEMPFGNVEKSLALIEAAAGEIFKDGKKPLFIGGEHLISFPVIKQAFMEYKDDLLLLHFDAHADLRSEYMGEQNSHASVIRLASEYIKPCNIYQFGIRSGTRDEFVWAGQNTNFYPFEVYKPLKDIIHKLEGKPLYITIDIDVLDPAYACGTGTPEPGGVSPGEMFDVLSLLEGKNVVGMDIVEVSPVYDPTDRTAILAAKLIREAIIAFM